MLYAIVVAIATLIFAWFVFNDQVCYELQSKRSLFTSISLALAVLTAVAALGGLAVLVSCLGGGQCYSDVGTGGLVALILLMGGMSTCLFVLYSKLKGKGLPNVGQVAGITSTLAILFLIVAAITLGYKAALIPTASQIIHAQSSS
jgi:hypothetical protein